MAMNSRTSGGESHTGPTEKLPEIVRKAGVCFIPCSDPTSRPQLNQNESSLTERCVPMYVNVTHKSNSKKQVNRAYSDSQLTVFIAFVYEGNVENALLVIEWHFQRYILYLYHSHFSTL